MQAIVGIVAGLIMHRTGRHLELIWIGISLLALGNGLYINLDAASSLGAVIALQMAAATGADLLFQPPLIAPQALVPPHKTAAATAILGLTRNLSTCIAIVVGQAIFSSGMDTRRSNLTEKGLPGNLSDSFSGSSAAGNVLLVNTISDYTLQVTVKEAFADSLKGVWILCTCTSVCAVIASGFVLKHGGCLIPADHTWD